MNAISAPALRLAFFGTPEFAVPTLERLLAGRHSVVCVVSQPDRGRGRGRKRSPSPVAQLALDQDLPLLRPERVSDPEAVKALEAAAPDLGIVVAFGQFIPKRVRELPSLGYMINGHASLLPKYRGANPIAHALLNGDVETGVSVMRVEKEMDAGAVALVEKTPIQSGENSLALTQRLSQLTAEAIENAIEQIAHQEVHWTPQDAAKASFASKFEHSDCELDWSLPAETLAHRIRALAPKPGAVTELRGKPLRILGATSRARKPPSSSGGSPSRPVRKPGSLSYSETGELQIATGEGWILPTLLQRSGGKAMPTADFLRGTPLSEGLTLGGESPTAKLDE